MIFILYNPHACSGNGYAGVQKVVDSLWPERPEVRDITQTDIRPFLTGLGTEDQVILCGGDGTLHFVINALDGTAPAVPVYVWWFGTGNDFLRDVRPTNGVRKARLNDYMQRLPTVEVNGEARRFLNNSSFGLETGVRTGRRNKANAQDQGELCYAGPATGAGPVPLDKRYCHRGRRDPSL
ncbi:MAG: acylglycerol kinase family protein [Oscillospiraceae bacterium]|nr:acylglycerol kinase family protein [Oscillospiraceae bacterium]